MKIYVAAKFEEKAMVRKVYSLLEDAGHTITVDWTQEDDSRYLGLQKLEYWRACGHADLRGVKDADLVLLFPHEKGKGLYAELGAALAWGKSVFIVGGEDIRCIFFYCNKVHWFANLDSALAQLGQVRK